MTEFEQNQQQFSFCCHGGAGDLSRDIETSQFYNPLTTITKQVYAFATSHLSDDKIQALDVVEFAVTLFENCETFNAGKGAVLTADSTFELEASLMNGDNLACGAALSLKRAKNPISVARAVMENTEHFCLVGEEAEELAVRSRNLEMVEQEYFYTKRRHDQLLQSKETDSIVNDHDLEQPQKEIAIAKNDFIQNENKFGTVGCVCWYKGHVAAATSTGGMTNKMPGRVGDSALIGCGTYANDETCAVSCTGKGEVFMQHVAAHSVAARMSLAAMSVSEASTDVVHKVLPPNSGGLIAINNKGDMVMDFNTSGMLRLACDHTGQGYVAIWEETVSVASL